MAAPEIASAAIENAAPTTLVLVAGASVQEVGDASGRFSVLTDGNARSVSAVTVGIPATNITLALAAAAWHGESITVRYTPEGGLPINRIALSTDSSVEMLAVGAANALIDALRIYHDQGDGATAATVAIAGNIMTLAVTGGTDAGSYTINFTDALYDTLGEVVTRINALDRGFVASLVQAGSLPSTSFKALSAVSCYGTANTLTLNIRENYVAAVNNVLKRRIVRSPVRSPARTPVRSPVLEPVT